MWGGFKKFMEIHIMTKMHGLQTFLHQIWSMLSDHFPHTFYCAFIPKTGSQVPACILWEWTNSEWGVSVWIHTRLISNEIQNIHSMINLDGEEIMNAPLPLSPWRPGFLGYLPASLTCLSSHPVQAWVSHSVRLYTSPALCLLLALWTQSSSLLFQETNWMKVQGWDFLLGLFDKDWRTPGLWIPEAKATPDLGCRLQKALLEEKGQRQKTTATWGTRWQIARWVTKWAMWLGMGGSVGADVNMNGFELLTN